MKEINDLRKELDNIDRDMALKFSKRMEIISRIKQIKKENGLQILDKSRELTIINTNKEYVLDKYQNDYINFITNVIEISKNYQKKED